MSLGSATVIFRFVLMVVLTQLVVFVWPDEDCKIAVETLLNKISPVKSLSTVFRDARTMTLSKSA